MEPDPVTLLDLVLLLLVAAAALSGWRVGLLARASVWIGAVLGFGIALWTVPFALRGLEDAGAELRFLSAVLVLAATIALTAALFGRIGGSLGRRVAATPLRGLDKAAGAALGIGLVTVAAWLALPLAATLPGPLGEQAVTSQSARLLAEHAPAPPDLGDTIRALVADPRFPDIIAELGPAPTAGPPPDDLAVPPEVLAAAQASTVRVSARGCSARYDGSGVTIAAGTVLTNAHVVAGSDRVDVRRPDGAVRAGRVVAFDPVRDLALIEVEDLGQSPLALATAQAGDEGAVIGYPGGQPDPRIAAVRVQQRRTALGRDIHGIEETEREILFLAAALRQGDSGAPVIDAQGRVVGVVFAVSPDRPTTAYALDRTEVDAVLAAPRVTGATGRCLTVAPTAGAAAPPPASGVTPPA